VPASVRAAARRPSQLARLLRHEPAPLELAQPLGEQGPAHPGIRRWISLKPRAPTISSRMTKGVQRSPSTSTPQAIGRGRRGLYKAMAGAGPITSATLAQRTGTTERYVRERLGNQAAGGYVVYIPADSTNELLHDQLLVSLHYPARPC
jgi:hypothetical protein